VDCAPLKGLWTVRTKVNICYQSVNPQCGKGRTDGAKVEAFVANRGLLLFEQYAGCLGVSIDALFPSPLSLRFTQLIAAFRRFGKQVAVF
jgi:hypothetical protein